MSDPDLIVNIHACFVILCRCNISWFTDLTEVRNRWKKTRHPKCTQRKLGKNLKTIFYIQIPFIQYTRFHLDYLLNLHWSLMILVLIQLITRNTLRNMEIRFLFLPCLINSTSFSVTKLLKAFAEAKRIAPACEDLPPPETVQTISCFPTLSRNWNGNNNCSLSCSTGK